MTRRTAASHDIAGRMADDIRQLIRPFTVPVHQAHWDHNRNKKITTVPTWHPPLLQQLRDAATYGTTGRTERRTKPTSKPPANVDAMQRLTDVYTGIVAWRGRAGVTTVIPVDVNWWYAALDSLIPAAERLAPAIADELADDVHKWWGWAARQAGWDPDDLRRITS